MLLQELLPTLRLRILAIEHNSPGQWWRFKHVNSPFCRLMVVLRGEASVYHHNREFRVTPGKMLLVPSFVTADYYCRDSFEQIFIHFTSRLVGGMDMFNLQSVNYLLDAGDDEIRLFQELLALLPDRKLDSYDPYASAGKRFMKRLENQVESREPAMYLRSDGVFRQLLSSFFQTSPRPSEFDEQSVTRFKTILEYIEEHLTSSISLKRLGDIVGLNPTYFSDLFHSVMGIRPVEYIIRRRLEKAQVLLIASEKSIKEICYESGFTSLSYFSRTFKKHTNLSPKAYREMILS